MPPRIRAARPTWAISLPPQEGRESPQSRGREDAVSNHSSTAAAHLPEPLA